MLPISEVIIRLVIAAVLSSLIGLERELRHKPIGLRTNILVGMGSALIMLVSISFIQTPAFIASGVISGIGFIGAGLIIQSGSHVHGITTAASIWVVAALGLAVGMGYYSAALVATLIALIALYIFGNEKLRKKLNLDDINQ